MGFRSLREDLRKRRWAGVVGTVVFFAAVINFATFWVASLCLGGDALHGKIDDGHHYLSLKGRYTEVSESVWHYSRIHTISVFVTHPLGILVGGGLIAYSSRRCR